MRIIHQLFPLEFKDAEFFIEQKSPISSTFRPSIKVSRSNSAPFLPLVCLGPSLRHARRTLLFIRSCQPAVASQ
ncbi:hypothetical protein J6590_030505 [Homalodisca vitripennis]|nr:hypothetical protein J6590_030505 [Homalodisca vitripennis]